MKLSKVLMILGLLFIIYSLVFGLKLEIVTDFENTTFDSSYSFKAGIFLLGGVLIFAGYRLKKANK